ncbi:hypothetical protein [Labrys sp. WJW]|uniref:hypothetical protein n=1 Tax=Labrys sp. WJW TaxID=1737983 RepID=UPI0012EA03EC|nr:hypothetical protein [Labrys sp. WJW]
MSDKPKVILDDPRRSMIERLSILYALSTSGPWSTYQNAVHPKHVGAIGDGDDHAILTHGCCGYSNANWIAAIHNEWPMIIELIQQLSGDPSIGHLGPEIAAYLDTFRQATEKKGAS